MATINLWPHNERSGTWILFWEEQKESIGRVLLQDDGRFAITTQGPHWNPMKSFAGNVFLDPEEALREVRLYFAQR